MGTQLSPLLYSELACYSVDPTSEVWISLGLYTLGIEVRQVNSAELTFKTRSAQIQPDRSDSHSVTVWIALGIPTP